MKLKRFLTGVLSAVMALSVCALPAAAADGNTTGATTTVSTSTIDKSKTGTITIHKYLMETQSDKSSNYGEELTDGDLPKDSDGNALTKPAEGVGFTLYKVMDMQALIDYYDGKYDNPVTVETYLTDGKINEGKIVKGTDGQAVIINNTDGHQKLTNKDGEVTFDKVPLGLYVAIETTKPAEVTSAVAPFLISVPMTKVGKNGNDAATEWLYDIHVYPKNQTTTGEITLEKKGVIGGEDKSNATLLDGVKFMLEKQNASNSNTWDKIVNPDRDDDYFVTNEGGRSPGQVTVAGLMPGNYRFSEVGYTDSTDKIKANETKYIIDNGAYFYFVIGTDDQNNQTVSKPNDVTNGDDYLINGTTITVYDYAPDVDKQVKDSHSNNYQVAADYNFGDKINYKVEVTIPANIEKLQNFVMTDTPKYVNDNKDSVKVYTDVNKGTALAEKAYNVTETTADGYKGFTITFTPNALSNVAGKKLYVYYTAELAKDVNGDFAGVVTSEGNANAINLKYSNKTSINSTDKDLPGNNNEIEDDAVVYTFEISINKKAEKADGTALAGVKFDLYKEVAKDTEGALSDADAAKYGFDTTKNVSYLLVKKDLVTDNKGEASYKGLANGNYWLVETQTVDGYNLLGKPKKVELSIAYKTSWKERNTYDTTGKLIKHSREDKKETFDKDTRADNNGVTVNGGTQSGYTVGGDRIGGQVTTIINKKGFQLPVTGGFGTLLFSGIGVLLVLAGVAVLFSMKKKNDRA